MRNQSTFGTDNGGAVEISEESDEKCCLGSELTPSKRICAKWIELSKNNWWSWINNDHRQLIRASKWFYSFSMVLYGRNNDHITAMALRWDRLLYSWWWCFVQILIKCNSLYKLIALSIIDYIGVIRRKKNSHSLTMELERVFLEKQIELRQFNSFFSNYCTKCFFFFGNWWLKCRHWTCLITLS